MKISLFWLSIITIIWIVNIEKKESKILTKKVVESKTSFKSLTVIAQEHLGKPYVYGKTGPNSFDCSGFVYGVHKQKGIILPRTSLNQSAIDGNKILRDFLQKGDLVFFDTANEGKVNHSGIYLGEGKFIHASSGKANSVTISRLDDWYKDKFKWGKRLNANK